MVVTGPNASCRSISYGIAESQCSYARAFRSLRGQTQFLRLGGQEYEHAVGI